MKMNEIESFDPASGYKQGNLEEALKENFWPSKKSEIASQSFRPKKKKVLSGVWLLDVLSPTLIFLGASIIGGMLWFAFLSSVPAKAAEPQIKDCMSNSCICNILEIEGFSGYVIDEEITALCAK